MHAHRDVPGRSAPTGDNHGPAEYRAATSTVTIDRVGALVVAPRGDLRGTAALNDAVITLSADDPMVFPICSVHPSDGADALSEVSRVAAAGARGLKLHPNQQAFDVGDAEVLDLVRQAGEVGLPVLFDSIAVADPGQPEKFMVMAMQAPSADIVLAHTFGPKFASAALFSVMRSYPGTRRNLYLELSALVSLFAASPFTEQIAWICRQHGLHRVLWGSDYRSSTRANPCPRSTPSGSPSPSAPRSPPPRRLGCIAWTDPRSSLCAGEEGR